MSRRGKNPLPGTSLDKVNWVKGSGTDADLLRSLVGESDAVVHSIGLLLDESSGLKNLNFITSGSGSVPGKGATYDSEMRGTAMALMEAAAPSEAKELPFVFVSAAEAGWKDDSLGSKIEAFMEKRGFFLPRYLAAKRIVEDALLSTSSPPANVKPIIARPSFMYSPTKLDILPLIPVWTVLNKVKPSTFSPPLRVEVAGAAIVDLIADSSVRGVVSSSELRDRASLAVKRRPDELDTLTSGLASISRLPFGTTVVEGVEDLPAQPDEPAALRLYEFEGCPFCRRVREVMTYLDLKYTVIPCGRGSKNREYVNQVAKLKGRKATYPYFEDGEVMLFESEDIIGHLLDKYGNNAPLPPPSSYFLKSTLITGWLPSLLRLGRGGTVVPTVKPASKQIVLYDYEGNQFSRLVREALTELDLTHEIRSAGKGSPRREELRGLAGKTTVPYVIDPNTGAEMGESADIVEYLFRTYS